MSILTTEQRRSTSTTASVATSDWLDTEVPCGSGDAELWFAESPEDIARAQRLCAGCPLRVPCLAGALERREPWGVWGGELFERGVPTARKRRPGRPRKDDHLARQAAEQALADRLGSQSGLDLEFDLLLVGDADQRADTNGAVA